MYVKELMQDERESELSDDSLMEKPNNKAVSSAMYSNW